MRDEAWCSIDGSMRLPPRLLELKILKFLKRRVNGLRDDNIRKSLPSDLIILRALAEAANQRNLFVLSLKKILYFIGSPKQQI